MLVLGRRDDELIYLELGHGERVTIRVNFDQGRPYRARLAIDAPQWVQITRPDMVKAKA